MLIISYDISNDKLRTKFSKFLCKFGYRLQYSVFEIKNSKRILRFFASFFSRVRRRRSDILCKQSNERNKV